MIISTCDTLNTEYTASGFSAYKCDERTGCSGTFQDVTRVSFYTSTGLPAPSSCKRLLRPLYFACTLSPPRALFLFLSLDIPRPAEFTIGTLSKRPLSGLTERIPDFRVELGFSFTLHCLSPDFRMHLHTFNQVYRKKDAFERFSLSIKLIH